MRTIRDKSKNVDEPPKGNNKRKHCQIKENSKEGRSSYIYIYIYIYQNFEKVLCKNCVGKRRNCSTVSIVISD